MSKETFYFSHDYNARADRKLVNVIMKHGMSGVGIYWCLIEMLYEEGGYLPTEYERISFELRTDTNVIQSIINDFDLFKTDSDKFWSDAVLERLQERCDKSEKARESINKRWGKYKTNTNVIRTNEDRNTIKERKGKKRKEEEVIALFDEFWSLYDKNVDQIKCEVLWMQMNNDERIECIKKLPEYIKSTPEKKFRQDPNNYLKSKGWNNEIINQGDKSKMFIDNNKSEYNELKKQVYGNAV